MLSAFQPKLQNYTQRRLEEMGVDVRLNTVAIAMDHDSITVMGPEREEPIPARTRIWAAGVQASPLAKILAEATGTGTDRAGRIAVQPDCSLPGHPESLRRRRHDLAEPVARSRAARHAGGESTSAS